MSDFTLKDLEAIIADRAAGKEASSWTATLVAKGIEKAAEKLGEEAVETVVAAVARHPNDLRDEAADLLYHLLVVLHIKGISTDDIMDELHRRTAQSGIAEKASRSGD